MDVRYGAVDASAARIFRSPAVQPAGQERIWIHVDAFVVGDIVRGQERAQFTRLLRIEHFRRTANQLAANEDLRNGLYGETVVQRDTDLPSPIALLICY